MSGSAFGKLVYVPNGVEYKLTVSSGMLFWETGKSMVPTEFISVESFYSSSYNNKTTYWKFTPHEDEFEGNV